MKSIPWQTGAARGVKIPGFGARVRLRVIADAHIHIVDGRDAGFEPCYRRMAGHGPADVEALARALAATVEDGCDGVLLLGDILSFPSAAGVEALSGALEKCPVPWRYVAGNHDWHFEGDTGSDRHQRETWIAKRLAPLYQGFDPMMSSWTVGGLRVLLLDDSTYEIAPEQRDFFHAELTDGRPTVLAMHIPLYVPGRPVFFGCGHPAWGADTDPYWELEQRERWPAAGHTPTTLAFRDEVFAAPALAAVLAGHIHTFSADFPGGKAQWVAPPFFSRGNPCLDIDFISSDETV